jgi:hypothetical protein
MMQEKTWEPHSRLPPHLPHRERISLVEGLDKAHQALRWCREQWGPEGGVWDITSSWSNYVFSFSTAEHAQAFRLTWG